MAKFGFKRNKDDNADDGSTEEVPAVSHDDGGTEAVPAVPYDDAGTEAVPAVPYDDAGTEAVPAIPYDDAGTEAVPAVPYDDGKTAIAAPVSPNDGATVASPPVDSGATRASSPIAGGPVETRVGTPASSTSMGDATMVGGRTMQEPRQEPTLNAGKVMFELIKSGISGAVAIGGLWAVRQYLSVPTPLLPSWLPTLTLVGVGFAVLWLLIALWLAYQTGKRDNENKPNRLLEQFVALLAMIFVFAGWVLPEISNGEVLDASLIPGGEEVTVTCNCEGFSQVCDDGTRTPAHDTCMGNCSCEGTSLVCEHITYLELAECGGSGPTDDTASLCDTLNGLAWEGEICRDGSAFYVTICNDGSQFERPTVTSCAQ